MSVRLGDIAPNFDAPTTQGDISFQQWLGDSWGVLFSHPQGWKTVKPYLCVLPQPGK